jgi:hypothetical protein
MLERSKNVSLVDSRFRSPLSVPMLVSLTRKTFEALIPAVATGAQYGYCWGKLKDLLRRVLISVVGMFGVLILYLVLGSSFAEVFLISGIVIGLFWLWEPVLRASLKNLEYRRYGYAGFWQGRVMDIFISEELVGTEETVNKRGDLVVVENRERCLNLEVADRSGFSTQLQVPLKRAHRAIDIGDAVEMVVFSNRGDLSRIIQHSDMYIPDHNLWVSDYPYLQRDLFLEVRQRVGMPSLGEPEPDPSRRPRSPRTGDRSGGRRQPSFDPQDVAFQDFAPQDRVEDNFQPRPGQKRIPREERLRREQELERLEQKRRTRRPETNFPNRQNRGDDGLRENDDRRDDRYSDQADFDREYSDPRDRPRRKRTPRFP